MTPWLSERSKLLILGFVAGIVALGVAQKIVHVATSSTKDAAALSALAGVVGCVSGITAVAIAWATYQVVRRGQGRTADDGVAHTGDPQVGDAATPPSSQGGVSALNGNGAHRPSRNGSSHGVTGSANETAGADGLWAHASRPSDPNLTGKTPSPGGGPWG